jgi:hypothetical protein
VLMEEKVDEERGSYTVHEGVEVDNERGIGH